MKNKKLFIFGFVLIILVWIFYPPSLDALSNIYFTILNKANNDKYLTVGSIKNYYNK